MADSAPAGIALAGRRGTGDAVKNAGIRIAVVETGEGARRFIRAVRVFNRRRGTAMHVVAVVPAAERATPAASEADACVILDAGPVWPRRPATAGVLEAALRAARADALWVGWQHRGGQSLAAAVCRRIGVQFVGPAAGAMGLLEDRIAARTLAERAGVPVAPWSGGAVASVEAAKRSARALGFPLALRATAGACSIRILDEPTLDVAFARTADEAEGAFGDATLFLERVAPGARLIEVDVAGDRRGVVWALGVRDCAVRLGPHTVVVESPSPVLAAAEDAALRAAAVSLARAAGFENLGTVSFLFDPVARAATLLDVSPGVGAGHPVSAAATGVDPLALQLHLAFGGFLDGVAPASQQHAVGVRLCRALADAADPVAVRALRLPDGPGLDALAVVGAGALVSAADPVLASVVARAPTRARALARLAAALRRSVVTLDGAQTNRAELLALLARPEVQAARADVAWLSPLDDPAREQRVSEPAHADAPLS